MISPQNFKKEYPTGRQDAADSIGNWDLSRTNSVKQTTAAKIAVIGEKDAISIFRAVGAEIFPHTDANEIKEIIKTLIEKDYTIILITEKEANSIHEFLSTLRMTTYPIILPIPNGIENLEYGLKRVQENLHKAIGSN